MRATHSLLCLTLSTLLLSTAVHATPSTAPDAAPSGIYALDASHTNILFSLSHLGYSRYYGRFNTTTGTLNFDAAAPEKSKLDVSIAVASVDTNNSKLQDELKSAAWFDAAQFPTATFTTTTLKKLSATQGKITGNLTLHGITKPVVLNVTFNGGGINPISKLPALGFSATGKIKRSEFGIMQYLPMVGDEVTLTIETEFVKKQ